MFNPLKVRLMRSVCGLDVHKDSVYLCILNEDGELIEKVFGVLTFQLQQMRARIQIASANLRKLFVKALYRCGKI